MSGNIFQKGIRFYEKYGIRGGIATLIGKGQIKDKDYAAWYKKHKVTESKLECQRKQVFSFSPTISILVPVYNTPEKFLKDMIESVRNQSYEKWQLCIANANPSNRDVKRILTMYSEIDDRIQIVYVQDNLGIAENTNQALKIATGDYIAFLDHDDVLASNALYEVIKCLNVEQKPDVIYTNEDKITIDGEKHYQPNFKPEFNLDLLRANNYICHFFVVKKKIADEIGGLKSDYNGAQDYDFIFRCTERAEKIVRIPKILYHWRMHQNSTAENPESKLYAFEAGKKAIEDHLKRCEENATVSMTEFPGFFKVEYLLSKKLDISVIIIEKKHCEISMDIINKLLHDYGRDNMEIIIVRTEPKKIVSDNVKVLLWNKRYNESAMLNYGIEHSKGQYTILLSAKSENIGKNYLEELVANIVRDKVAVVGGKVYYKNRTIKNAGIYITNDNQMIEPFKKLPQKCIGYMNRQSLQQEVCAVISDNMIIDKQMWEKAGGFDERLEKIEKDLQFCKKIQELGCKIIYNPDAEIIL